MALLAFGIPLAMSRNYGMLSTFLTPLVFLLLDFAAPVQSNLILARLADTALGAGVVLVVGYLFWPSTWRPNLGRTVADGAEALAGYVRVGFSPDRTAIGVARRKAYRSMSDVRAALQSSLAEPPPTSTQAAAWWPLIAQLERATDRLSHLVLLARYGARSPAAGRRRPARRRAGRPSGRAATGSASEEPAVAAGGRAHRRGDRDRRRPPDRFPRTRPGSARR